MRDIDKIGTVSSLCIYSILNKIETKIWSFSRQNLTIRLKPTKPSHFQKARAGFLAPKIAK
jgi:hypothetical protein